MTSTDIAKLNDDDNGDEDVDNDNSTNDNNNDNAKDDNDNYGN